MATALYRSPLTFPGYVVKDIRIPPSIACVMRLLICFVYASGVATHGNEHANGRVTPAMVAVEGEHDHFRPRMVL